MRCLSCNVTLSDFEATRKYKESMTYIELCNRCYNKSYISGTIDRHNLQDIYEIDDYYDNEYYDELAENYSTDEQPSN